jgi:hypothetical protein
VAGWYLLFAWVALLVPFGMHAWGFFHLGLPILLFPINAIVVYRVLGYVPPFKTPKATPSETSE